MTRTSFTHLDLQGSQRCRAVRARNFTRRLVVHVRGGVLGETELTEIVAAALLRGAFVSTIYICKAWLCCYARLRSTSAQTRIFGDRWRTRTAHPSLHADDVLVRVLTALVRASLSVVWITCISRVPRVESS